MKSFYNMRNVCVKLSENGKIQNFMYIMKLTFLKCMEIRVGGYIRKLLAMILLYFSILPIFLQQTLYFYTFTLGAGEKSFIFV